MKYSATFLLSLANGALPFILPDHRQFVLPAVNDDRNVEEIFSSFEKNIEKKVDRLFEVLEHAEGGSHNDESPNPSANIHDYANNEYAAAAFSGVGDDNYRKNHQDHYRWGNYPGGHDDTDPHDGTDPGDGPPYYRSPKEPPHHTPTPGGSIPRVPLPRMPPKDRTGPHTDKTLWDMISSSKHTSRFREYIKDDDDIMKMLKDKDTSTTVFAPSNEAFKKLDQFRKHHHMSKDMIHRVLMYHLSRGTHGSQDLRYRNTLMTMLRDDDLGKGMHQRVRIGMSQRGPTMNFYSQFTMLDVYCKNGVIHGLDAILLPPPDVVDLVEVLPTEFSTSTTALARVGLLKELTKLGGRGLTVFVPSNRDWQKLGFKINAFLFSDCGRPYLRALMKYHISPGNTLYSDALVFPDKKDKKDKKSGVDSDDETDDPSMFDHGYSHAYLPTLLKGKYLSVDITRLERFLSFRINGMTSIIISDGIAQSGSIQVPDHILIPPHSLEERRNSSKMVDEDEDEEDETQSEIYGGFTLAELKNALEPFVRQERMEMENSGISEL